MLVWLLSLKRILTDESYEEFLHETFKLPALILIFSPYCGHCQAVLPTWGKLITKYESESDVSVGQLDCVAHSKACRALADTQEWPSFAIFTKGRGVRIDPNRDLESLSAEIEKLRRHNLLLSCLAWPDDFDSVYPYFRCRSHLETGEQSCASIQELTAHVHTQRLTFFWYQTAIRHGWKCI
jgi:thiol-disulfide isomerase/thioredoxin